MNKLFSNQKNNKFIFIIAITLIFSLTIIIFYYIPKNLDFLGLRSLLRSVENTATEWRFASKAFRQGDVIAGTIKTQSGKGIYSRLVVAAIDNPTIKSFGSLTIDREFLGTMLNHFNESDSKPSLVFFDFYFDKPSVDPEKDKKLLEALRQYKGIVGQEFILDTISSRRTVAKDMVNYDSAEAQAMRKFELPIKNKPAIKPFPKVSTSLPEFINEGGFLGTANMANEENLYVKCPLVVSAYYYIRENNTVRLTNVYYPSVVLAMAAKLYGTDMSNVIFGNNQITIRDAVTSDGKTTDIKIPTDNEYRMLINYKAAPKSGFLRKLSAKDITRAGLPRNAIVLVGVDVEGFSANRWLSPLGTMSSFEHIAYSLGTIMNKEFLQELPWYINGLYLLVFTLLIGFLLGRGIRTTILAIILAIIIPLAAGFVFFQANIEIFMLLPLVSSLLVLLVGEIFVLLTEQREKRFIKSTFSKYISPDLVNILIQNPEMATMGGQEKEVTMLFSDIRGFTTLSEGMTAKELISFLNIYLSRMTDIVMETQGTLDKYIGDAVVAFWGTPLILENHALNACRAAVKMIQALKVFNDEQTALGNKPINIGVGLSTGSVIVGNIGSDKKRNYTAIGETALFAEELQDENKVYMTQIIISDFTYQKVKDKVVVRELDVVHARGEEKPVRIYELLDVVD